MTQKREAGLGAGMRAALLAGGLAILTACTSGGRELGADLDEGNFGTPTRTNRMLQTGELSATQSLQQRFAAEVPSTINFAFDSAVIDAEAAAVLRRQADWIRQFPEVRFRVYGHTDLVGSAAYNYQLGLRRANAVVAFLGSQGISRSRLEALVSYGDTQPVVLTQSEERANRRTITQVSGFVRGTPALLDGKYAAIVYREYLKSAVPLPATIQETGNSMSQPVQ